MTVINTFVSQSLPAASRTGISAAAYSSSSKQPLPFTNRFTLAFQHAKQSCPQYMEAYAVCVTAHHNSGTLEKHCCEEEFRLLKDCFKESRVSTGRR